MGSLRERFSQNFKQLQDRFVKADHKNWNKLLPYFFIIIHVSMDFSLCKLPYGLENQQGPVSALKSL